MRCPKCGYISYDHLEECLKCKKNIKTASDDLQGSVFNVAPPLFLKLQPDRAQEASSDDLDMFVDDEPLEDFVDEDLEVLIDEGDDGDDEIEMEGDIVFEDEDSMAAMELEAEDDDVAPESFDEDDDSEFELDFGQLEDTSEQEMAGFDESEETAIADEQPAEDAPALEIPEELADLSDLAPPAATGGSDDEAPAKVTQEEDIDSLDIDALDFELGLGGLEGDLLGAAGEKKEAVLALDDIDFSEALADVDEEKLPAKPAAKSSGMGMDEELNFDLDLGGLSVHDDV